MPPKHQRPAPATMPEEDEEDDMMEMGHMMDFEKYLDPDFSKKFMANLPEKIRQRAQVLAAYDEDLSAQQSAFKEKQAEVMRRYDALFAPLLQRRKEIVTGAAAVSDEDVKKGMPEEHVGQIAVEAESVDAATDAAGLDGFWLRVLRHHTVIDSTIEPHDEDVLKHLIDITSATADGEYGSFKVIFTFAPNDFFTEEQITATVTVKGDESDLTVTPISWKPGRNVMMQTITKKQRAKRTGQVRTISHDVAQPSFFWLFQKKSDVDGEDGEDEEEGEEDDEEQRISMLEVLHTCIVPNAVRYYTGEAPDGFSDVDEEDEVEEEEEEEEEEDIVPRGRGGGRGMNRGGRGGRGF